MNSARPAEAGVRHKRHHRGGFSLIEVMVAIAVVGIGLLALIAVIVTGTRSNLHGEQLSRATFYARRISESIRQDGLAFSFATIPPSAADGLNDPDGTFRPLNYATPARLSTIRIPLLDATGQVVMTAGQPALVPADDKFQRNIQTRRASTDPTAYNFSVLILDVTVRWQGGKTGDGMRKVKITSMLKPSA